MSLCCESLSKVECLVLGNVVSMAYEIAAALSLGLSSGILNAVRAYERPELRSLITILAKTYCFPLTYTR
ncbi:MAG: hypothetical protein ACFB2W_22480 [Leptolyngbyaceae cyanobacterium]